MTIKEVSQMPAPRKSDKKPIEQYDRGIESLKIVEVGT